jgi:hypothetical protein
MNRLSLALWARSHILHDISLEVSLIEVLLKELLRARNSLVPCSWAVMELPKQFLPQRQLWWHIQSPIID